MSPLSYILFGLGDGAVYYFTLFVLFLTAILLRYIFASVVGDNSDEWVSHWHIKRNVGSPWIRTTAEDSLIPGKIGYPVLMHWIVSRFWNRDWRRIGLFLNIFFDILGGVLFYLMSFWLLHSFGAGALGADGRVYDHLIILAATASYLYCPLFFPISARLRTIKGRTLGGFLFFLFFSLHALANFSDLSFYLFISLAFLVGIFLILSSQFAFQATVFVALTLVFFGFYWPAISFASSVIIGYLLPFIRVKDVIDWFISHKIWYLNNYKKGTTASGRNNAKDLFYKIRQLFGDSRYSFLDFFEWMQKRNSFLTAILFFPLIFNIILLFIFFDLSFLFEGSSSMLFWAACSSGAFIAFLLTSFRPFLFLGQAERYLELGTPFFLIFSVSVFFSGEKNSYLFIFALFLTHALLVFINLLIIKKKELRFFKNDSDNECTEMVDSILHCLQKSSNKNRVATFPCKLSFFISFMNNDNNTEFYFKNVNKSDGTGMLYRDEDLGGLTPNGEENFDVFKLSPEALVEKYGITHFIFNRKYFEKFCNFKYLKYKSYCIFENENYIIYEVRNNCC